MPLFSRRRKTRLTQRRLADSPFGPVQISHDRWPSIVTQIHGPGMPTVTILSAGNGGYMSVNGHRSPLRKEGHACDPRRAARTRTALVNDRAYELRPTGLRRAQVLRDGRPVADARGTVATYSPVRGLPGIDSTLTWHPGVDPTDVAVGQAMVVVFGAGAPGALTNLTLFWLDWFS